MVLADVNVLIYAHREDSQDHELYAGWLHTMTDSDAPFGVSELGLSGFVRIVTNPRVFPEPTPLDLALDFAAQLLVHPRASRLRPGHRHFEIFAKLCRSARARGKLVADAYHAALAIEHGCELVTTDGDFARFPSLRWRHPLVEP